MRYGVRTELTGMSQEQYDSLHPQLAAMADDSSGLIVHIAGPTPGGWQVLEVWESKADHERFMQKAMTLMPPGAPMPSVQDFEVYTCETYGPPSRPS